MGCSNESLKRVFSWPKITTSAYREVLLMSLYPDFTLPQPKLFIDGQWRDSSDGQKRPITRPADNQEFAEIAWATQEDVNDAVEAADRSFRQGTWSQMPARERSRILQRVAQLIKDRFEDFILAESADTGKPVSFARRVDIKATVEVYEFASALALQLDGSVRDIPGQFHAFTRVEPVGVVAAISPFNFPLVLATTKIGTALAAGNSIVHKPATVTPVTALLMGDIFREAGIPDGVVNILTGSGRLIGDTLTNHPLVRKVGFTGSTEVGAHIAQLAGRRLIRMTAELGGNAANIIFEDADLDKAARISAEAAFLFNTGQFCMAGPRILVHEDVYDVYLDKLRGVVEKLVVGNPADPNTEVGPVTGDDQYSKISQIIENAKSAGGRIVAQAPLQITPEISNGFYIAPTVIDNLPENHPTIVEETFGPVVTVQKFSTEEQALDMANNATPYGLAGGMQTSDLARAHRIAQKFESGVVWVNTWAKLDPVIPFGGVKDSGWGREYGREALESYTQTKTIVMSYEE